MAGWVCSFSRIPLGFSSGLPVHSHAGATPRACIIQRRIAKPAARTRDRIRRTLSLGLKALAPLRGFLAVIALSGGLRAPATILFARLRALVSDPFTAP